jgi:hypothetical protein
MKVALPRPRVLLLLISAAFAGSLARATNGYLSARRRLHASEASAQHARRSIAELPAIRRAIRAAGASDSLGTSLLAATQPAAALAEIASVLLAEAPQDPSTTPQLVTVDDTTRVAGLRRSRVRLRATGSTADLMLFVERLLLGTTPLRLDELQLDVVGQGTSPGVDALLSMEAVVSAWYREGA